MFCSARPASLLRLAVLAASLLPSATALSAQSPDASPDKTDATKTAPAQPNGEPRVLWVDPGVISEKNLLLGAGGAEHQPKAPFTFVSEASSGTNPKFDSRDADDKKWRVKLGPEARPEVVASRLLWAVGYFANEDYLLPRASIHGIQLKRGHELVQGDTVTDARFSRKAGQQKKTGIWKWKNNPFMHTREFNGLRVMMAVMNNWDLKDVNNAVYEDSKHHRQIFLVSDVGATFASNNEHATHETDKGNLESFEKSKFIVKRTDKDVTFGTPSLPKSLLIVRGPVLFPEAIRRSGVDWIGHDIPLADARWMGSLLAQLSHEQLEDAFRAGDFPDAEREQFVSIVESRIAELQKL